MTGHKKKNCQIIGGDLDRANEFNLFYNRFDRAASVCPSSTGFISPHGCPPCTAAVNLPAIPSSVSSPSHSRCKFTTTTIVCVET